MIHARHIDIYGIVCGWRSTSSSVIHIRPVETGSSANLKSWPSIPYGKYGTAFSGPYLVLGGDLDRNTPRPINKKSCQRLHLVVPWPSDRVPGTAPHLDRRRCRVFHVFLARCGHLQLPTTGRTEAMDERRTIAAPKRWPTFRSIHPCHVMYATFRSFVFVSSSLHIAPSTRNSLAPHIAPSTRDSLAPLSQFLSWQFRKWATRSADMRPAALRSADMRLFAGRVPRKVP